MRVFVGILLGAGALCLRAEPPRIDAVFPTGGQRGTECDVMVSGQLDPWPLAALCDDPGVVFTPDEKEKGRYRVKIAGEAEPGARLLRFHNREGAAPPRIFVIGAESERVRSASETPEIAAADLPLTVNGRLESASEASRFVLDLEAGQTLVAEVASAALDAPLDPLLHLFGPGGEQVAFNHDVSRIRLDPRLVFPVPAAGRYVLHLSAFAHPPQANIRFADGPTALYRLTLRRELPAAGLAPPGDPEPEDEEPLPIAIPASVGGRIDPPGDVDRFRFQAVTGDPLRFEVSAEAIGSWIDPVLVIEDGEGRELKRQDDIDGKGALDVQLDWSAPADGTYLAKVLDLNGAGGFYRLAVSKPVPGIAATAAGGVYALGAGEKLEIAVHVERRHGFAGELEVGADALPPGVTAAPVAVPEKGEAKLVLEAAPDAPPAGARFHLWVAPTASPPDHRVPCRFALKGTNADPGSLLVNETPDAWLTVLETK